MSLNFSTNSNMDFEKVNTYNKELSIILNESQQADSEAHYFASKSALIFLFIMTAHLLFADTVPELDCVIEPSEVVDIGSATAGVLEAVDFDRGDSVAKNEVVARLESSTEKAAAELARVRSSFDTGIELRRTSAEFFERNQQRSNLLKKQNAISSQQIDQLDTESRVAELQVRQEQDNKQLAKLEYNRARQALKRRAIKSPIDGVVMDRFKSVGEYIEDTAIMRVAQLNPLFVETIIPVTHMGKIKPGMQAKVTPAVPGQDPKYAIVTRIDRVADAASGTFGVRLELDNPNGDLVSGVRCALEFDSSRPIVSLGPDKRPKTAAQTVSVATKTRASRAPVKITENATAKKTITMSAVSDNTKSAHCFEAGPIGSQTAADALASRVSTDQQSASIREIIGDHPGQYFVLTRSTRDHTDALKLIARLKEKGITDTHLLLRGSYASKISLGLFTSLKTANKRAAELNSQGVDAHIAPRSPSTYWINIASADASNVTNIRSLLTPDTPDRVKSVPCDVLQASIK